MKFDGGRQVNLEFYATGLTATQARLGNVVRE
jgi:hypothetical protein